MTPGKKIYLLEIDGDEWVWCDDPHPDNCHDRKIMEYELIGEYRDEPTNEEGE